MHSRVTSEVESMRAIARGLTRSDICRISKKLWRITKLVSLLRILSLPLTSLTIILYRVIELSSGQTICLHLAAPCDTLLEQDLLQVIEPYSVIAIEYVAQQVGKG